MLKKGKLKRAVFYDRDGVIVNPVANDAPRKVSEMSIIDEIIPAVKTAKTFGFLNIVVSNQPDIALGKISESTRKSLEKRFLDLLNEKLITIDEIYYCYHHEKSITPNYPKTCNCRKPKPGMILKAANKFNIDLVNSYMIGDRATDIIAGSLSGTQTILFDWMGNQKNILSKHNIRPSFTILNLQEVKHIISADNSS